MERIVAVNPTMISITLCFTCFSIKADEIAYTVNESPTMDAKIECRLSSIELYVIPAIIGAWWNMPVNISPNPKTLNRHKPAESAGVSLSRVPLRIVDRE